MEQDNNKIKCDQVTDEVLLEYIEGSLEDSMREKVYQHFGGCRACRVRTEEIRQITAALRDSPELSEDIPVPASVDRAVFAAIRETSRAGKPGLSRTLRWLVPSAAGILLVVVVVGLMTVTGHRAQEAHEAALRKDVEPVAQSQPPAELPAAPQIVAPPPARIEEPSEILREQLKQERQEKQRYARQLTEADSRIEQLTATVADLEGKLLAEKEKTAGLQQQVSAEKEKTTSLTKALKKRDEDAKKLQETLTELRNTLNGLQSAYTAVQKDCADIKKETTDLRAQVQRLESQRNMFETLAARFTEESFKLREKLFDLRGQLLVAGDVNGDRKVDVLDSITIVERLLAGYGVAYSREADANGDGRVDVGDALQILNKALVE